MHQRISRKIIIYLFLFSLLTTINNKYLININFPKIDNINITGLNNEEHKEIENKLSDLKSENILFLNKLSIIDNFDKKKIVEKFSIFKIYPSKLEIKIEKTNFLAITKKNGEDFIIGSNGKFIKLNKTISNLPFIFGSLDIDEFLKFKNIIDISKFDYKDIKNLFFYKSNRWDIQTHDGLFIQLPKDNLEKKLNLLAHLLEREAFKEIKMIDLRQKNQVVVNEK